MRLLLPGSGVFLEILRNIIVLSMGVIRPLDPVAVRSSAFVVTQGADAGLINGIFGKSPIRALHAHGKVYTSFHGTFPVSTWGAFLTTMHGAHSRSVATPHSEKISYCGAYERRRDIQSDPNRIQYQVWNSLELQFEITALETFGLRIPSKVIQPSGVMADSTANLSKSHK